MSDTYGGKCDCCGKRARKGAVLCNKCAEEALRDATLRYYGRYACTYTEYLEEVRQIEAQAGYRREQ